MEGTTQAATLMKLHRRCGHIHTRALRRVARGVKGMEELSTIPVLVCDQHCKCCTRSASKAALKPKAAFKCSTEPFHKLHCNLSWIISAPSFKGHKYLAVFVDDTTNYKWVFSLREKSEYLRALNALITRVGKAPRVLRTDEAGEMNSAAAKRYYAEHKIWHECSNSYEHFQNARSEAAIGNLSRRARTLLVQSGCPKGYWPEALQYTANLVNRLLPYKYGETMTVYECFHSVKPDNSVLVMFGCMGYLHVAKARSVDQKYDKT
eukprot:3940312-Rhodomonas_salina.1